MRWISLPTSVEPVNATLSSPSWPTSAAPTSPAPGSTLSTPGGSPASAAISASTRAVSGVVSAGLRTTVLPQASAGAIFQAAISSGKFHGITAPATPSGRGSGPSPAWSSLSAQPAWWNRCADAGGHVDVAGLADRFAVVERLQHGQLAGRARPRPGRSGTGTWRARHPASAPTSSRTRDGRPRPPGRRRRSRPCRPPPAPPRWPGSRLERLAAAVDELRRRRTGGRRAAGSRARRTRGAGAYSHAGSAITPLRCGRGSA